jgi:hypothetical protein
VELAGSTGVNGISSGAGCYAALHENFNDYYPNYPNYTKSSVALNADSSTAEGWTNSGTGVQAQVAKTTKFMSNATTQSPNVHSNLTTTATYLDVDSANPPWSQTSTGLSQGVDMDSTAANAGMFSSYISGSAALWQYERNTHAGPVFGEGKNHWFYSGLLDGVEAQVGGTGAPDTLPGMLGPQIPLFVDFDLTVIHPLQVNHGMGNFENWSNPGVSGISVEDTAAADAYRMEEIIFGHAPSMSEPYANSYLWSVVPRALQEQMLVSPVAARYGVSTVSQIQYMVNGTWSGSSSAAKTNDFTRPQVTYSDGDTIIANAQSGILTVDGVDLPQYGWMAQGPGLLAYTALVGGVVADYAETQANSAINPATATSYFANARNANDLATLDCAFIGCDSSMPALAEMNSIVYNSAGTFTMNWTALQNFDSTQAYTLTINLSSPSYTTLTAIAALSIRTGGYPGTNPLEGLVLQGTTNAVTGLVKGVAYTVTATLCTSNACQPLYGVETNTPYTYTMGTLTVTGTPPTSSFTQTIPAIALDNYLNMSGSMLNFGAIQTDGMVSLQWNTHYKSNNWLISAWPRFARGSGNSTPNIEIADAAIPMPVSIECHIKVPGNSDYLTTVTPIPVQNGTYWKVNLTAGAKYCFFTGSDDTVGNSVTATLSQPNPFTPTNLTKTVTLTNSSTSTSSLTIGSIAVSGTGTSYFSVPASPCGTSPLAIGGTCNFTVTFTPPTGSGSTVANLVVTDNAGNTPQTSVLSGTWGSWAGLSLSPDTIFFDDVIDGSSGTPQTITLTNNGTAALTGLTFALTATPITSPATPLTFAITSNSCGTSLNPGQCTLQVNFTPTAWKASSAILTVIGTNPASSTPVSATITLSGTGLPPT